MDCIRYFDWNKKEKDSRTARLVGFGYTVISAPFDNQSLPDLKRDPPLAVIISLDRRPSHGRDIAMVLRKTKATRLVPLILVGGDPEKIQGIQQHLPDAVYTSWEEIKDALKLAILNPPSDPVVPRSLFDPYRGTPLPKKLGIKTGSQVRLVDAPENFENTLGETPQNVSLVRQDQPGLGCDIVIWFVSQKAMFDRKLLETARLAENGTLWVVWPKKTSAVSSDLSQPIVRAAGLAVGLVDFKVCSVDQTWTGLCFRWRKET